MTAELNHVVVVDLDFKNTLAEKTKRRLKGRLDPIWHQEEAKAATHSKNWYAATFHYAWLLKSDPERSDYYDKLHAAFDEFATWQKELGVELHLNEVVKDSLNIPLFDKRSH